MPAYAATRTRTHTIDAKEAAKLLGIGHHTLLKKLRESGATYNTNQQTNIPKKQYREAGLLTTTLTTYWRANVRCYHEKLAITADGMEFIRDLLAQQNETNT